MAGAFESQKSEIEAFISDRNLAHLSTANISADTALANLAQIPGVTTSEEFVGLMQSLKSYRSDLEERDRSSSAARKIATAEVTELTTALGELKTQTQATTAELRSQIETERQKILAALTEQQKLFADAQAAHNSTYNDTLVKVQEPVQDPQRSAGSIFYAQIEVGILLLR